MKEKESAPVPASCFGASDPVPAIFDFRSAGERCTLLTYNEIILASSYLFIILRKKQSGHGASNGGNHGLRLHRAIEADSRKRSRCDDGVQLLFAAQTVANLC